MDGNVVALIFCTVFGVVAIPAIIEAVTEGIRPVKAVAVCFLILAMAFVAPMCVSRTEPTNQADAIEQVVSTNDNADVASDDLDVVPNETASNVAEVSYETTYEASQEIPENNDLLSIVANMKEQTN